VLGKQLFHNFHKTPRGGGYGMRARDLCAPAAPGSILESLVSIPHGPRLSLLRREKATEEAVHA
jgi:hypothetical protein